MPVRAILENIEFGQDIANDFWYLVTVTVMSSVNRPEEIQHVYAIIENRVNVIPNLSQLERNKLLANIVLKLREAILKSYIATGFPKAINALQHLADVTPEAIKALLPTQPLRKEETWPEVQTQRQRGRDLFGRIYNRHTERVIRNMYSFHPDLAQTALNQLYGPTLSEISVLSPKETSMVVVTGLMMQNVRPQLIGHFRGAFHNGATKEEMVRLESIVTALAEYYKTPIAKL